MNGRGNLIFAGLIAVLFAAICTAQFRGGGFRRWRGGDGPLFYTEGGVTVDERTMQTAREVASHSTELPMWTNAPGFEKDNFSFCRIIYHLNPEGSSRGTWITDF